MTTKSLVRPTGAILAATALTLALSACVTNGAVGSAPSISVESTADDCVVSEAVAPSGTVAFDVTNSTDQATEFYILADDGLRIVGEVENIAPGAPRTLTLSLRPGEYFTVCKPGMVGDGIGKAAFTVVDSGDKAAATGTGEELAQAAASNYVAYVKDQAAQLVPATRSFVNQYLAGDDEGARASYAISRAPWERIETVAESFGVLDPLIDYREADVPEGEEWTGWHRIEKDLWPPADAGYVALTLEQRQYYADLLTANTQTLYDEVHDSDYSVTIDSISNGAIGLMDEVASKKITGEEEIWSHTDLWDFQANLEGARVAYEGVRDIVIVNDPELVADLDGQFDALQAELTPHGSFETGFVYYNQLAPDDIRALSDAVNSLAEPLSRLTSAVVS